MPANPACRRLKLPRAPSCNRRSRLTSPQRSELSSPGLKLPLENKEVNFAFHVEHAPNGGFILQSTDGKDLPIIGSTHAEIQSKFAEKLLGALGKDLMPELSKVLAAADSGDVKVVVKRTVRFSLGSH